MKAIPVGLASLGPPYITYKGSDAMPIEFRCQQCGKLLRTPDETAGRQARCPECGAINVVPAGGESTGGGGAGQGGGQPSHGPAAPPSAPPAYGGAGQGGGAGQPIDLGDIFETTWKVFMKVLGPAIIGSLVLIAAGLGLGLASWLVFFVFVAIGGEVLGLLAGLVVIGLSVAIGPWLAAGQMIYFLNLGRRGQAELGDLFSGGPFIVPVLLASIVMSVCVFFGLLLLIIPGVFLALAFSQALLVVVDRRLGPMDALGVSWEITKGSRLMLLVLAIVVAVINGLLNGLTGGLAAIVTTPFFWLMQVIVYFRLTGQPVVPCE
jgi:phage FluMu protein Com